MRVCKRVFSFVLALAIVFGLCVPRPKALAPLATAAGAIAGAPAVAAFLAACGFYFTAEAGYQLFVRDSLEPMIEKYNAENGTNFAANNVATAVVNGTLVFAKSTWNALRDFAIWLTNQDGVSDNNVGSITITGGGFSVPVLPLEGKSPQYYLPTYGAVFGTSTFYNKTLKVLANAQNCKFYVLKRIVDTTNGPIVYLEGNVLTTVADSRVSFDTAYLSYSYYGMMSSSTTYNGVKVYYDRNRISDQFPDGTTDFEINLVDGIKIYDSFAEIKDAYLSDLDAPDISLDYSSVVIDVPAALGEDTDYAGIAVPGISTATSAEEIETAIATGIEAGELVNIRAQVVPVTVAEDVAIVNGEIVQDVVIGSADIPLTPSAFEIPALNTVFPFSIPWDVMTIISVFNADPVAPHFAWEFVLPFDPQQRLQRVDIDLSPWDSIAALCRAGMFLVFVISVLMFFYNKLF